MQADKKRLVRPDAGRCRRIRCSAGWNARPPVTGSFNCVGSAPGGCTTVDPDPTDTTTGNMNVGGVKVDGVTQQEGPDYTVSGDGTDRPTVTFTIAPPAGAEVRITGTTGNSDEHPGGLDWGC